MTETNGSIVDRRLPDGRIVAVVPLIFDRARLTIGHGTLWYDDSW